MNLREDIDIHESFRKVIQTANNFSKVRYVILMFSTNELIQYLNMGIVTNSLKVENA